MKKEEEIVMTWLKSNGYYRVAHEPNHLGIEADGKIRRMIVAVETTNSPNETTENIKEQALKLNREAWLAVVEPKDNDITWSILK